MFLSIQELELRKISFNEDLPEAAIDFGEAGFTQSGALHAEGEAELLNTLGEIRVRGDVNVDLNLECGRCLEPVRFPLDEPFDLYYRPAPKGPLPHEVAIDDGEAQIGFYDGDGIELNEILREHILLSLPMHLVCREDCAGICPQCGQNRNIGGCECKTERIDDRWAALRSLQLKESTRKQDAESETQTLQAAHVDPPRS
ncbi:MAG: DUF177 domain-containing protein [Bryobacteraceae bacterium]|nr:DUF177 domain-containing protein [Bryobacteraceae bacterium]